MKLIAHYDQHELGLVSEDDTEIEFTRRAARAVLVNDIGHIAVMHFENKGVYKMPGGGIDEGETIEEALRREIREETGYEIKSIQEIGVLEEDRYYCGMHQTSYCFTVQAGEFVGTDLTEYETAQGMKLKWVDTIEKAIATVESSRLFNEADSEIGNTMMKLRETTILRNAQL